MLFLYQIIFYLALPFIFLRLLWRSRKVPAYRKRWAERLGFFTPPEKTPSIWLHAVSFGEAKLATTLVKALQEKYPGQSIVVTTTTVTGSQQIQRALGDKVFHVYLPYDVPAAVQRFLKRVQPKIAIILETELWPTIFQACAQQKIPLMIANARLSERSAKQYAYLGTLMKNMWQAVTQVLAQTAKDAERFMTLGLPAEKIMITGNVKYDVEPAAEQVMQGKQLRQQWGATRPVWIAASTHAGEESIILQAFQKVQQQLTDALLILVPRHPERFDAVVELASKKFLVARHSDATKNLLPVEVYVGDTMGDLLSFYAAADVAFVGGSLVAVGGHNLLEPAALALPIISGEYLFHFQAIAELLQQVDALTIVHHEKELAEAVLTLLQDKKQQKTQGHRAWQIVKANQGALVKHLEAIENVLKLS